MRKWAQPSLASRWGWSHIQINPQEVGQCLVGLARSADRRSRCITKQGIHEIFPIGRREARAEHDIERRGQCRVTVERNKFVLVFRIRGVPLVLHVRRDDQLIHEGITHARHLNKPGTVVAISILLDDRDFWPARTGIGAKDLVPVRPDQLADRNLQRNGIDVKATERISCAGTWHPDDDGVIGIISR